MEHISIMDMLPEEELIVSGHHGKRSSTMISDQLGVGETACAYCGTRFAYYRGTHRWRIKIGNRQRLFCSYGCMRRMEAAIAGQAEDRKAAAREKRGKMDAKED